MFLSGGGQISRRQHLLSRDGRLLIVCIANSLRVYSAITAEYLFDLRGHKDEVTSICLHPVIPTQVYSSSRDGSIKLWDLQDGTEVQSWSFLGEPLESLVATRSKIYITSWWRSQEAGRAFAFSVAQEKLEDARFRLSRPHPIVVSRRGNLIATFDRHTVLVWTPESFESGRPLALHHTKRFTCVAISPDGSRVAAGDATGRILVWHNVVAIAESKLSTRSSKKSNQDQSMDKKADNMIPNSSELSFARPSGANSDRSLESVYDDGEPPAATVHWHAHAVGSLEFSNDGAFLLSGGQEAVLVLWDVVSGRRAYMPRLGGSLVGIASCAEDDAKYSIRQSDNTIRVINAASMRVECSIHGLRPVPWRREEIAVLLTSHIKGASEPGPKASLQHVSSSSKRRAVPFQTLTLQPDTGLIIVAGPHALLQWYDVLRDSHVDKLQLSHRNMVSLTEMQTVNEEGSLVRKGGLMAVLAMKFSSDSSCLATLETRPSVSGDICDEAAVQYALKFWDRCPVGDGKQYGNPYRLNTIADDPHRSSHGFGDVTSLAFHPLMELVVTTSSVGEFKLWSRERVRNHMVSYSLKTRKDGASNVPIQGSTWKCAAIGEYRNEPLTACAFSRDGSVLAIGSAPGTITLWNVEDSCTFIGVLPPAPFHHEGTTEGGVDATQTHRRRNSMLHRQADCIRQLEFLGDSAMLLSIYEHGGAALYNLLTMECEWAKSLGAISAAVDSMSAHWAVIVSGESAANVGAMDQEVHAVIVFSGAGEFPVAAWKIKRHGSDASIAFLPSSVPEYVTLCSTGIPDCSPLMVVSGEREFEIVKCKSIEDVRGQKGGLLGIADGASGSRRHNGLENASGFDAMFGGVHRTPGGQVMEEDGLTGMVNGLSIGGNPSWKELLDAPSHALPPISTLCPTFLRLMVGGSET